MKNNLKYIEDWLQAQKIQYRTIEHPVVHHVGDEGPELEGLAITKCLLLTDKKSSRICMVAMRGEKRLDLKKLAFALGTGRLQFVRQESVENIVGVKPGSVSIFNVLLPNTRPDIEMVVDCSLLVENEIGFHPNSNNATVLMSPQNVKQYMITVQNKCTYLEL